MRKVLVVALWPVQQPGQEAAVPEPVSDGFGFVPGPRCSLGRRLRF